MSETFTVALGGRTWQLPHLPFRLVMSIQPALFRIYAETAEAGAVGLDERQIEALARAVWRAVAYVEPGVSEEEFLALPFSVADLFAVLPAISQAVGLRLSTAAAEASPETGK